MLVDFCGDYLCSGNDRKATWYPIFDLKLLKRCLHKVFSSVFRTLDPFSMTEFVITRLKGAEHCDWVISRFSLLRAIVTGQVSMPSLVEIVINIVGVWRLIVVYIIEIEKRQNVDGDNLVLQYPLYFHCDCNYVHLLLESVSFKSRG